MCKMWLQRECRFKCK